MRTYLLILSFIIVSSFSLVQTSFSQTDTQRSAVHAVDSGTAAGTGPTQQLASGVDTRGRRNAVNSTVNVKTAGLDGNQATPKGEPNWWKDKVYFILAFIGGGIITYCFMFIFKGNKVAGSGHPSTLHEDKVNELNRTNAESIAKIKQLSRERDQLKEDLSKLKSRNNPSPQATKQEGSSSSKSQQSTNNPVKQSGSEPSKQFGSESSGQFENKPPTQSENESSRQPGSEPSRQAQFADGSPADEFIPEEKSPTIELVVTNTIYKENIAQKSYGVLYFPNPNMSGDFKHTGGKPTFIEGTSIYKFSLISPTEALYEFCEEKSAVTMAINNRNDLILSVAEESNAYTPNATKILIADQKKGKAKLEEQSWIITEKAKIKYI